MKALQVFLLLLFLSVILAGGSSFIMLALRETVKARDASRLEAELNDALDRLLAVLMNDPTPEADSFSDPVWKAVSENEMLRLRDVSSALNPNWVRKNLFEKTNLGALFTSGFDASALQQYREDSGFHLDIRAGYGSFFDDKTLDRYFTPYGWANLNTSDEFALRRLAELRSGDAGFAEIFHSRIQSMPLEKKLVKPEEIKAFLADGCDMLFPAVNAEPSFNVHFLDPRILEALLSYPDFNIREPASRAAFDRKHREKRRTHGTAAARNYRRGRAEQNLLVPRDDHLVLGARSRERRNGPPHGGRSYPGSYGRVVFRNGSRPQAEPSA